MKRAVRMGSARSVFWAWICWYSWCLPGWRLTRSHLGLIQFSAQIVGVLALASYLHTNLIAYVKSALAIVREYNDGMALGPWPEWAPPGFGIAHWMTFLFFWAFVISIIVFIRKRGFSRESALFIGLVGIATFVLYKTSVVRSDYLHNKSFLLGFPIIMLALLIHGPESPRPIWRGL